MPLANQVQKSQEIGHEINVKLQATEKNAHELTHWKKL
jgi:hypothetical protein